MSAGTCTVPPEGWACTRASGHEGPCAALPTFRIPAADRVAAIAMLVSFGEGRRRHLTGGTCPHEGAPGDRTPGCDVCQAMDTVADMPNLQAAAARELLLLGALVRELGARDAQEAIDAVKAVVGLRSAVETARNVFADYAEHHRRQGSDAKADVNFRLAGEMDAALNQGKARG